MTDAREPIPTEPDPRTAPDEGVSAPEPAEGDDDAPGEDAGSPRG